MWTRLGQAHNPFGDAQFDPLTKRCPRRRAAAARRDETTDGRPQFRPHMHTNTMSPVSFGPLS